MAQESAQGQVQTVVIQKPYRNTGMGGFDRTWVFTHSGDVVKPISTRSRSGNHGWDTWHLEPGRYIIVSASRPNLKNGARPFRVVIQCVEIKNGVLNVAKETSLSVMSLDDVKEWARGICP